MIMMTGWARGYWKDLMVTLMETANGCLLSSNGLTNIFVMAGSTVGLSIMSQRKMLLARILPVLLKLIKGQGKQAPEL